jgi:hypothetical protein
MKAQLSATYRKIGNSLYKKQGDAFIHCAIVPSKYRSLAKAVEWYEGSL